MPQHDHRAAWDAQRTMLRALVFSSDRDSRPSTITAGRTFLVRTDHGQVERTAARLATDVLARRRRGAAPLTEAFASSLAASPLEASALASRFCQSRWFAAHGEVPDSADQLSAEEAFYRFLCDEQIGHPTLRLAEFVDAMISALAVQPRPAFRVPTEIERAGFGYFAVVELSDRTLLFAAVQERVVRGPIDSDMAAVLRHRGKRSPGSAIPASSWQAAIERLASVGLDWGDHPDPVDESARLFGVRTARKCESVQFAYRKHGPGVAVLAAWLRGSPERVA